MTKHVRDKRRPRDGDARPRGEAPRDRQNHKGPQRPRPKPPAGAAASDLFRRPAPEMVVLYGYHPVREALRVGRRKVLTLIATEDAASRLEPEIADAGVAVRIVATNILDDRLGRDAVHQGLMLEARPLPALDVADVTERPGLLLLLDGITDPHNVGAIIRTAAAFGVVGLVMTERHAPPLDGVLAKAASGALEHVPIAQVVNLARALDQVGEAGFQRIGLDSDGAADLGALDGTGATALVLGAEGSGLRRLTRQRCDVVARLDLPGAIRSLNVSNACAVALAMLHRGAAPRA